MDEQRPTGGDLVRGPVEPSQFPIEPVHEPAPDRIFVPTPQPAGGQILQVWRYNNDAFHEALLNWTCIAYMDQTVMGAGKPIPGPLAGIFIEVYGMPPVAKQGSSTTLTNEEVMQRSKPRVAISQTQPSQQPMIYFNGFPYTPWRNLYLRPNHGVLVVMRTTGDVPDAVVASFHCWAYLHGTKWMNGTLRSPQDIARVGQQFHTTGG